MSDLLTFIGGAAVGTLVTYLVKNEQARKTVDGFIDGAGKRFTDLLQRATPETAGQAAPEPATQATEKPKTAKRAARPSRAAKAKKPHAEEPPIH